MKVEFVVLKIDHQTAFAPTRSTECDRHETYELAEQDIEDRLKADAEHRNKEIASAGENLELFVDMVAINDPAEYKIEKRYNNRDSYFPVT